MEAASDPDTYLYCYDVLEVCGKRFFYLLCKIMGKEARTALKEQNEKKRREFLKLTSESDKTLSL